MKVEQMADKMVVTRAGLTVDQMAMKRVAK